MRFIDFLERLLLRRKEESSQPLRIINNPVGVVVAKTIEPYDIDHMYDDPDKMPGLCPVCHYTIEKIPNLDYHTATTKDIAMTYDGFFIVRDRFKRFCDEQGYENLTFIPLNKSSKHYYFMPNDIFPIDVKHTIIEHAGKQCPQCGRYQWVGTGGHTLFSNCHFGSEEDFIMRLNILMGDRTQKFDTIIVGLKTAELMKQYDLKGFDYRDVQFLG